MGKVPFKDVLRGPLLRRAEFQTRSQDAKADDVAIAEFLNYADNALLPRVKNQNTLGKTRATGYAYELRVDQVL